MQTRGAADRLLEFFAERPEPVSEGKPKLGRVLGEIEYDKVSFAYPGRPALFQ